MNNIEPLTLNTKEIAERLHISRSALYKLIKNGTLKPLKNIHKRNYLFNYQEILKLISRK
jgi:excisionase family DNA binding protein